jgi:hypothetical protein
VNVALTNTQRLTGVGTASLTPASNGLIKIDLCYQDTANGGAITAFSGGGSTSHLVATGVRGPMAAAGTATPNVNSATVKVGLCISTTTGSIAASDISNGWVQVTN